jgi:hypothetical protein
LVVGRFAEEGEKTMNRWIYAGVIEHREESPVFKNMLSKGIQANAANLGI